MGFICVLLSESVCAVKNLGAYNLKLSALRSGCVRTPHLPSQDAAACWCMCIYLVCLRVCVVTIWAEHQGHAWTAR